MVTTSSSSVGVLDTVSPALLLDEVARRHVRVAPQPPRHYRDAYATQAQQIAQLKARIAELETRDCR
jgi:hypothetical protein